MTCSLYMKLFLKKLANRNQYPPDDEPLSIIIKAGEAYADLPDDLRDAKPEELHRVRIVTRRPAIMVDLKQRNANVWTSDPDAKDLAAGIRDFVNRRRSFWGTFFSWERSEVILVLLTLGLAIIATVGGTQTKPKEWFPGLITGALAMIAILGLISWTRYRIGAIQLIPRRESEIRRLGGETRKQLWIALISTIVGGVIVGLAGLWAGLYVHH